MTASLTPAANPAGQSLKRADGSASAPTQRAKRIPPAVLTDPTKRLSPKMVLVGADADVIREAGGKAIYEFRAHPRKQPWEKAADETRASYRARMQELLNALAGAGFVVRRR